MPARVNTEALEHFILMLSIQPHARIGRIRQWQWAVLLLLVSLPDLLVPTAPVLRQKFERS